MGQGFQHAPPFARQSPGLAPTVPTGRCTTPSEQVIGVCDEEAVARRRNARAGLWADRRRDSGSPAAGTRGRDAAALLQDRAAGAAPHGGHQATWSTPCAAAGVVSGARRDFAWVLAKDSGRVIAGRLGRAPSTVSRDIAPNGGKRRYRAWRADEGPIRLARRPKPAKPARCARLRHEVERRPALVAPRNSEKCRRSSQIAARLVHDYPDTPEMRVSHEAI